MLFKLFGFAVILVSLVGCAQSPSAIDLDVSNNGMTIEASVSQMLNIKLDSNATTGYKWNLATGPDAKVLKFVSSEYVVPPPGSQPLVGAGGNEVWKFQTVAAGITAIRLAYFRPFDPKLVAKEFSVTIIVK